MRLFKIAIVGAGPSGYFTAQAFQNAQNDDVSFVIDMFEKLPTPWGLVRSGVAPDHQKIKTVSKVFEKIAKEQNFRLFGNVEIGKDISLKDLKELYDAVVLATGAAQGRKLDVPGESLKNSFSASDFVPWYNSHPDFANLQVNLSTDTAVIIGAGNVALDVARILALDPSELDTTDIAEHALLKLRQSNIRRVIICGRRGAENAAFTLPELRDLSKLKNTDVFIDAKEIKEAESRLTVKDGIEKDLKSILEALNLISHQTKKKSERIIEIKFLVTPIEFKGNEQIEEVILIQNKIENGKTIAGSEKFIIKSGLVISAIGYESVEYSGIKIENGRIKNIAGHVGENLYTTGWAKRGPKGVIGTNKSDSNDVVQLIIKNLEKPKKMRDIKSVLKFDNPVIDQLAWEKINAFEVISGELSGKPRIKVADKVNLIRLGKPSLNS